MSKTKGFVLRNIESAAVVVFWLSLIIGGVAGFMQGLLGGLIFGLLMGLIFGVLSSGVIFLLSSIDQKLSIENRAVD